MDLFSDYGMTIGGQAVDQREHADRSPRSFCRMQTVRPRCRKWPGRASGVYSVQSDLHPEEDHPSGNVMPVRRGM